jgi:hypothetical protein
MPRCEMIVDFQVDRHGDVGDEIECGREAIMRDNNVSMCFTCARAMVEEGDILSARGTRRFREIERVVASLPS